MQISEIDARENIYTISRLNSEVKYLLENNFSVVWVEGEISNFTVPGSGHWYFSLKDTGAQVRCAMFRGRTTKLGFVPKEGTHVLIRAKVSLYENRGDYQLIAEYMEERGEGKLRRAFEILKKKLELAGLFDPKYKKPFPAFPKQIGVITSSTGAAIRDVLTVLKRRFPCVPVIIYPTLVQGETAAPTIVKAIEIANSRKECDVLLVTRGGGSLEDLWPFNEEIVARAIFESQIPIISGVGHEVDFTIADFVADLRAATPSAAAEILTPDQAELLQTIANNTLQILRNIKNKLSSHKNNIAWMLKTLDQQHPKRKLTEKIQRIDFAEAALLQHMQKRIYVLQSQTKNVDLKLHRLTPGTRIQRLQHQVNLAQQQLKNLFLTHLAKQKTQLANAAAKLDTLSPLATLQRGYAIATTPDHHVIRSIKQVQQGETINLRLSDGALKATIA